jgi:hypothetical protein
MSQAESWAQVKVLVESVDLDIEKFERGNASAGLRLRKSLRLVKKIASDIVRDAISVQKARDAEKKAEDAKK